ncbi:tRNA (cytosine(32)/uridine(32)-2'-O)-methyltransferase TrmJ [[Haemophilus] felis]|nr:tRNA (cytosine(32)/uridine(32)-2'-O)-methyltransferase TrmJ [[Haemophilus] felis]NBI43320.1 tRNA (cytosine(32)/uridine(32)-2'-O)-methyltransferase TrmJ [[Haemophilus] felis]
MLKKIRIVLIETSHSGNIGSTARAMKTMGLSRLYLVSPKQGIDEQAFALSAGAEDILRNTVIVDNFVQAVADCSLVIGASARLRHLQHSILEPHQCAIHALQQAQVGEVAIVFGRERIGLTNDELLKCHYHLNIPANPEYSSLNLAMAVQLICYELRMVWLQQQKKYENQNLPIVNKENAYPDFAELEYFLQRTENLYTSLGFIQNQGVMQKLRRLYQRAAVEKNELNILQGMLSRVEDLARGKK